MVSELHTELHIHFFHTGRHYTSTLRAFTSLHSRKQSRRWMVLMESKYWFPGFGGLIQGQIHNLAGQALDETLKPMQEAVKRVQSRVTWCYESWLGCLELRIFLDQLMYI